MSEHDATGTEEAADTDDAPGVGSEAGAENDSEDGREGEIGPGGEDTPTEDESAAGAVSGDDAGDTEDIDDLSERVAAASDEQIAREIASLRSLVADLEARDGDAGADADSETDSERVAELESKLARKQADFENFKKRMNKRREEERERATEDLVTRLLGVRDDLVRALSQEEGADIRGGVESTLTEFDRVLDDEGVSEISPEPGTDIDPQRHEVMLRVDSDHSEGTVAEVFRSGYEMGEKVLRPAQVTVSEGDGDGNDGDGYDE